MRPCGPVPVMLERSMSCSFAILRASGDVRSFAGIVGAAAGDAAGSALGAIAAGAAASAVGDAGSGDSAAGSAVGASGAAAGETAVAVAAAAGAAFFPLPSPMIATGVPIGTTVPAGTSCCSSTPLSNASRSMVALSVSISARMSPLATLSPTFLSHFESSPSSIVSDRRGITTSDIAASYSSNRALANRVASRTSWMTRVRSAASGMAASSSGFAYGSGTSAAATRRTGASR